MSKNPYLVRFLAGGIGVIVVLALSVITSFVGEEKE